MKFFLGLCGAVFFSAVAADAVAQRRAADQMNLFSASAAARFLDDAKNLKGYDLAAHRPAVDWMIAHAEDVKAALTTGRADLSVDEAVRRVEDYRLSMLANPVLDFDRILCVRRFLSDPRGLLDGFRDGGTVYPQYELGVIWMNAHNHTDVKIRGFRNSIVAISGFRSPRAKYETVYEPTDGTIVRDLDLDFDASRILFSGIRSTNDLFGVFEVPVRKTEQGGMARAAAATLISPEDGHYDIQWWDACYLPNRDQVILLGTAAYQFLPCEDGNRAMSMLYRMDRKTGEVRQLCFEQDSDFTPTIAPDGRVMYVRWEYSDLPHYFSRELMTMNPDGVGQLALWGSGSYFPTFFSQPRAVPGESHLLSLFASGHHDRGEFGRLLLVDPTLARAYPFRYDPPDRDWGADGHAIRIPARRYPKERTGLVCEIPGWGEDVEGDVCDPLTQNQFARGKPYVLHPWPLSSKYVLTAAKTSREGLIGLYLADVFDNFTLIAEVPDGMLIEPIPLVPRKRPPVIPDRSVKGKKTCSVHIADIYEGPGLAGLPRGTVKKMRVFSYHFNYHKTGGHNKVGLDRVESSWDIKRILGTVDVEEDGSCCFEMPANTPVSFQPLDAKGAALQLMRSWTLGMPGERISCTGCHEDNRSSVKTRRSIADEKYNRGEIQQIRPLDPDGIRPWGFAAELWPLLKRDCTACHGDRDKAPKRGSDSGFVAGTNERFVMQDSEGAYRMLHPYIRRPGAEMELEIYPVQEWHASTSPLVQMLEKGHHGVQPAGDLMAKIYEWIDLNAPYYGKWDPPAFETDRFAVACANQRARRCELMSRYGNVDADPEAEYDRFAAVASNRLSRITSVAPKEAVPAASTPPAVPGWPMDARAACTLQLGRIDGRAPVTLKTVTLGEGQTILFRRIPAGTFVMGSEDGFPDERPATAVTIDRPFWISETEIRNDQYNVFDPHHDSRYQDLVMKDNVVPGMIANHRLQPVIRVSWNEARAFAAWVGEKAGCACDLPTEAQWEWAARAGSATPFPWGGLNDDFSRFANFADRETRRINMGWEGGGVLRHREDFPLAWNYPLHEERWTDDWRSINFTRRGQANRWGLYDMHGNAAEWTRSEYRPYPYRPNDGREDVRSATARRVVRGGAFDSRPREATSSFRQAYEPWRKLHDVGFRIVLPAD